MYILYNLTVSGTKSPSILYIKYYILKRNTEGCWWLVSVIPAIEGAEPGASQFEASQAK
jgi:hypothetical protein